MHFKAGTESAILSQNKQSIEFSFEGEKKEHLKENKQDVIKSGEGEKKVKKIPEKNTAVANPLLKDAEVSTYKKIKSVLFSAFQKLYPDSGIRYGDIKLEHPSSKNYGDYSSNLAMIMASKIKVKPIELAEKISQELNKYIGTGQSMSYSTHSNDYTGSKFIVSDVLENVKAVLPGFINIFLAEKYLISQMGRAPDYGKSVKTGKKMIIEFTDPNPFKEFHIGHVYSNSVGESIARINEELGAKVARANYFGDVGMHVAKSIWGMKKLAKNMDNKFLAQKVKYLGEAYAIGATAFEEDEKAKEEMKKINYLVFIAAQDYMQKEMKWEPRINYRQFVKADEKEIQEVGSLFQKGWEWSLAYFESIYRRLGAKFDYYYPESIVGKYGLHTRVFINALGLPTYETKELGLAPTKYKDFQYDFSMIVTAKEINEYFQVLLKVLSLVKPDLASKTRHLGHGLVKLPEGKMSSRTGKIISGEALLEMVKTKLKERLHNTGSDNYTKAESEFILEKTAVAAIKYSLLKVALPSDIVFDLEKSVNFEGDSGPYLQYTYARCRRVLRKAEDRGIKYMVSSIKYGKKLNEEEKDLLRTFYQFEEVVLEAGRNFLPSDRK